MSRQPNKPRGAARAAGLLVAWVSFAVGAGLALLYAVPELQLVHRRVALVAAFIPFGILAWAAALVLFLAAGRGWGKTLALVAVLGLVAQLTWASGYLPARTPAAAGPPAISVFTLNSRCESQGREELAEKLRERRPDVVVVQGASDRLLREHLSETGLVESYPHQAFFPMGHLPWCGTAVYSRFPVAETAASTAGQPAVRVRADGGEFVLVPADVPGPQFGVAAWESAIAGLGVAAEAHAAEGWPVIVAGDFNAVREHLPFRRLVGERPGGRSADGGKAASSGLVNAAEAAGAGWQPTYRADRWFPPLIEIDHVLVSPGIEVVAVQTVRVGGHAHLALMAWVRVK